MRAERHTTKNTPTMANDNQTVLMMSIQRKKNRVKEIEKIREPMSYNPHQTDKRIALGEIIDELNSQITEDEKLLAVEKDRNDLATEVLNALDEACNGMEWRVESEPESLDESDYEALGKWRDILKRYNEKYGTDGK